MNDLVVRGGQVLTPHGWRIVDVVAANGRFVTGLTDVHIGGETFDGDDGQPEGRTGGAGAARAAVAQAGEGEAAAAAREATLAAAGSSGLRSRGAAVLDARGLRVVPGFVDLQCNGGYGIDLAAEPERLWELAALLPRTGVTAWLPTIVTGPPSSRSRALAALRAGPPPELAGTPLAVPLGLHLEGPFLAPVRRGAHDPAWLRSPADEAALQEAEVDGWSAASGVRLVTLAPELPGALDLIRTLVARGIVVSAGHSSATEAEAEAAIRAGVRYVTHLFNGMTPLHHRSPGLAAVALTDPRLVVGLIADGVHVTPRMTRVAAQSLGPRLSLVTDAVALLGAGVAGVRLGTQPVVTGADAARLPDGTLAGSTLTLDRAVRNIVEFAGLGLEDAVRAVTAVPAGALGLPDRGVIEEGAAADVVLLDDAGEVVATVVAGRVAYARGGLR